MNNEVVEPDKYGVYAFAMPGKIAKITAAFAEKSTGNTDLMPALVGMTGPEETTEADPAETEESTGTEVSETTENEEQTVFAFNGSEDGTIVLSLGSDRVLTVSGLPEGKTADDIIWSSSDMDIVYVTPNGILTGAGTGTVTITATVDGPDGAAAGGAAAGAVAVATVLLFSAISS